jgi:hypothetical protein
MEKKSYFPIEIMITEKGHKDFGKTKVINYDEIPIGTEFIVKKTNVK